MITALVLIPAAAATLRDKPVVLGLEFVAEVGMVVVVDDGDEENLTMPRCAQW
jgi:hypothetical protein